MTRSPSPGSPMSSITDQTDERSASPEGVGGVSTQAKKRSVALVSSSASSVKVRRSRLRSITSGRSASWKGSRPAFKSAIRSSTTSRTTTRWPRSAKQAPVTRPTHPAPKIPIAGFSVMAMTLLFEGPETLGDLQHRLVRERVENRVDDPVGSAAVGEHDHVQVGAVVVEPVLTTLEHLRIVRVLEDRGVLPVGLLNAPVLVGTGAVSQADGLALADLVDALRDFSVDGRRALDDRRHLQREARL